MRHFGAIYVIFFYSLCLLTLVPFQSTQAQFYTHILPLKVKDIYQHKPDVTELLRGRDRMLEYPQYIAPNRPFRDAEGMKLPPSYWGLMFGNKQTGYSFESKNRFLTKGEQCILCWMGLREDSLGQEKILRMKLKRLYGSIKSADGQREGIPAAWVTDTLTFITDLWYYGGIIRGVGGEHVFRKGFLLPNADLGIPTPFEEMNISQEDHDAHPNAESLSMQATEMKMDIKRDSRMSKLSTRDIRMVMLSYEVNKACPSSFSQHKDINIPIYVYLRNDGRSEMIVLDESSLKDEDMPFIHELQEAFPKLPILMFGFTTTIDGELMGGAIFNASRRSAWTFEEVEETMLKHPNSDLFFFNNNSSRKIEFQYRER